MNKLLLALSVLLAVACGRNSGSLYDIALEQMPISVERGMRDYMSVVEKPVISDIELVYDCDSICVIQCKAFAKNEDGEYLGDTVRYYFVKDNFMTRAKGSPVYGDLVMGAEYLDRKGRKSFCRSMKAGGTERYLYYLGMASPL